MAMRGLRPIAEIQYLDYLLYALQIMSDDLATLQWRTTGGQKAPGHRAHARPPAGGHLALRLADGGHYQSGARHARARPARYDAAPPVFTTPCCKLTNPAIVVEVLNGYRVKERLPDNIGEFTVPLGVPEVIRKGTDVTLVTYGACCRIALDAAEKLSEVGIEAEIDRRAIAAAVRSSRPDRRIAQKDQPRAFRR